MIVSVLKRLYTGLNLSLFQEELWKNSQLPEPLKNFSSVVSARYRIYCPQWKSIYIQQKFWTTYWA